MMTHVAPRSVPTHDVIVVGARCAGSPTAMLLARAGYRVLLVDRATFPNDSMRAHWIRGVGTACLARWELIERVAATGCPPLRHAAVDFGDFPLTIPVSLREGVEAILVEAAAAAGAEVRQGFAVQEILFEDGRAIGVRGRARGGREVIERARVVVGSDGQHSLVARAVGAPAYETRPTLACCYYGYFGDLAMNGADIEVAYYGDRFAVIMPTNDGLTLVAVSAPIAEFPRFRADLEGAFFASLARVPGWEERVRAARRAERWRGSGDLPNFLRKP